MRALAHELAAASHAVAQLAARLALQIITLSLSLNKAPRAPHHITILGDNGPTPAPINLKDRSHADPSQSQTMTSESMV